jgi:hypothetical protein
MSKLAPRNTATSSRPAGLTTSYRSKALRDWNRRDRPRSTSPPTPVRALPTSPAIRVIISPDRCRLA